MNFSGFTVNLNGNTSGNSIASVGKLFQSSIKTDFSKI